MKLPISTCVQSYCFGILCANHISCHFCHDLKSMLFLLLLLLLSFLIIIIIISLVCNWHHHHPHPIQIRQSRVVAISCQVSRAHLCAYMATPIQYYTVVCVVLLVILVILALAVHCNIEHVLPHMARRANRKCVQQNLVHCPICHIEHSSRQYVIRRKKRYLPEVIGTKIFPISEDGWPMTSKLKARYSFLMLGRQWSQRRPRKQAWGWVLSNMWSKSWEELDPAGKPASRRHYEPENNQIRTLTPAHQLLCPPFVFVFSFGPIERCIF